MVSTVEKRLLRAQVMAKYTSPRTCRLCHGPLTCPTPSSAVICATTPSGEVDCHPSCLPFACGGCVGKGRASYGLIDMSGHDGQCSLCEQEVVWVM